MSGTLHRRLQVPPGVQCFVGDEARRRRAIEAAVVHVFEGWDYEEIIPPLFDFADVFAGESLQTRTYSFVGRDGSLLALRPDFTSLLAKIAAGRLADRPVPLRLYYAGEVLRYEAPKAGRQTELYQMGLEHLGGPAPDADAEVLAIADECLSALGVDGALLALGHVGVFGGLLAGTVLDPAMPAGVREAGLLERLRERVDAKDGAGAREALAKAGLDARVRDAVAALTTLSGGAAVLEPAAANCAFAPRAGAALRELAAIVAALAAAGLGERVTVDLSEVRGLDYYTGLVFRAFAPGLGFELGAGGRYDTLLSRFGRPMPAVGFSLGLDRLALLLDGRGVGAETTAVRAASTLAEARRLRASGARVRLGTSS